MGVQQIYLFFETHGKDFDHSRFLVKTEIQFRYNIGGKTPLFGKNVRCFSFLIC